MSIKDSSSWMKDKTQSSIVKNWVTGETSREDAGYETKEFRIFTTEAQAMRFCMTIGIVLKGKRDLIDGEVHSAVKQNDSFDPTKIIRAIIQEGKEEIDQLKPVHEAAKYCAFGIDYIERHLGDLNNLPKYTELIRRFTSEHTEFCGNSDCQWPIYSRGEQKEPVCPKCSAVNDKYQS
jgi:hypothetical protein